MNNPFDQCSQEYEQFRPGYPPEVYDAIISYAGLDGNSLVLDIGAGPGKGSLPLIERHVPTVSADPSLGMIRQGHQAYPALRYVCCAAEALPFGAESFHLLTSAQSFHWFEPGRALPEFARVLYPSGFFAVYWNTRDVSHQQAAFFEELAVKYNPKHNRSYRDRDWGAILEEGGWFRVAYHKQFFFTLSMDIENWIGLARSISYIRAIDEEKMPAFEHELRQGMSLFRNLDCPYITNIWLAQKTEERSA